MAGEKTRCGEGKTKKRRRFAHIEERLGHHFSDALLLQQALTHPSACVRGQAITKSYERLEFLGDRVLGLVVADMLLRAFPKESEGAMAKRFTALVRKESLARVCLQLSLQKEIILAKGEEESGERTNPSLQSDVCESIIAALYLDGGFVAAQAFVERLWRPLLHEEIEPPQDAKTALQEWAQARGLPLPKYKEKGRSGPAHDPLFAIEVSVVGEDSVTAEGTSKRKAEQKAAVQLLNDLKEKS